MTVPGWCERCKRPRRVRVTTPTVVAVFTTGIAVGVCAECEDSGR